MKRIVALMTAAVLVAGVGCGKKTDKMGRTRPPVDELSDGGRGLQGKDVITASDKMAASLLSLPALNASRTQWTIVVDRVENMTTSQRKNFDAFLIRLRSKLVSMGQGRVQLIENKQKFYDMRARELETSTDRFGQGGTGAGAAPQSVQPDYFLSAKLVEMPTEENSYFLTEFTLTHVDRRVVWSDMYEVTAGR